MATSAPQQSPPPDESLGPTLVAVTSSLALLIVTTTSLRLYTRWARRSLGWDDYTIAITAVLAVVRTAIQAVQVQHGNGRHQMYISHEEYVYNNMLGFYTQIFLFASSFLLKVSICLLLLRIKDTRGLKILLCSVMVGLFLTNFGCIIIMLAQCSPVETYWKETGGVCWDPKVRIHAFYVTITYNLLTDLLCSLLPLVAVWRIRIPVRTKIFISGLISLGLLATGFGVARALSLRLKTNDMSWTYALASMWSTLELFIGIIAANLALSRSIYREIRYGTGNTSPTTRLRRITKFRGHQFETSSREITPNYRTTSTSRSDGSEIRLSPWSRRL